MTRLLTTLCVISSLAWTADAQEINRFEQRVPLKANPGLGDRGYRHMEFHHQYKRWHNQLGTHCCNVDSAHGDGDCRITTAKWNSEAQMWEALVDGEWRLIESDRHVLDDYGVGPEATVCAGEYGTIYCFDQPEPQM